MRRGRRSSLSGGEPLGLGEFDGVSRLDLAGGRRALSVEDDNQNQLSSAARAAAGTARLRLDRMDDTFDDLEDRASGAFNNVHIPDQIMAALHDIESHGMVQAAIDKIHRAYSYVEPVTGRILSRVGSLDETASDVDFVIPPSLGGRTPTFGRSPSFPRASSRFGTPTTSLDILNYTRNPTPPLIRIDAPQDTDYYPSHYPAPDEISLLSATDSELKYERVRPNTFYRTSPGPIPKHKKKNSFFVHNPSSSSTAFSSLYNPYDYSSSRPDDNCERLCRPNIDRIANLSSRDKYYRDKPLSNAGESSSSYRFNRRQLPRIPYPRSNKLLHSNDSFEDKNCGPSFELSCAGNKCSNKGSNFRDKFEGTLRSSENHENSGFRTEGSKGANVVKRQPSKLLRQTSVDIDGAQHDSLDATESDPLVPQKPKPQRLEQVKKLSSKEVREQFLKDKLQSVVCINGKTYVIPTNTEPKKKSEDECYGGASQFFENSQAGIDWQAIKSVGDDGSRERPKWLDKTYTALESFVTNAHDPWLSEADRDPLACQECCTCFATGQAPAPKVPLSSKRKTNANHGPLPGAAIVECSPHTRNGNCIARLFNNETFCVVSKRFSKNYVHRFSASKSLFLFSPWHPLRRAAIFLSTNQYFDYLVMATILVNCIFLAMTTPFDEAEYIFLAIYSAEMVTKTIAKGFILNKYTYLRNPWNWLDFIVIASGYVTLVIELGNFDVELGNLAGLRTFRVLRALKTVSIMPGLKTIINALLNSIKQLVEVMTLTVFCLMVFALFALQVYMGVLKNKCVLSTNGANLTDKEWDEWVQQEIHWYREHGAKHPNAGAPVLCGNVSGARVCPDGYSCLPDIGDNPNFGYTSFDNFLWSMLTTFQLITLDFWEDVYNKIMATGGPLQVGFFAIVVFFGSFYLINLMLAVVAMSYEEEAENSEEEKTKDLSDHRYDSTFSFDPRQLTHAKPLDKRKPKNRRVVVMAKGAGIISDTFNKKQKRSGEGSRAGSAQGSIRSDCRSPALHPIGGGLALPLKSLHTNPVVEPPKDECEPCSEAKNNCKCHCHDSGDAKTGDKEGQKGGGKGAAGDDTKSPLLKPAPANPAHRQPSLDDSGVVGDHDVGDNSSLVQAPQEKTIMRDPTKKLKCNGVSPSSPAALSASSQKIDIEQDEDDELVDRNCPKCKECCMSYTTWLRFQAMLYVIVHDAVFDLFIMLCIILNTVFLAVEHHGMSYTLDKVLEVGNRVFTAIFTLECTMKIMALSREFFLNNWNVFDLIIVFASLLDLGLEIGSGLSVLRGMRLLRVLKLAQSWRTMRVLLSIIISTLGALGNLTFVLLIIIYIFAVIGMRLFGENYTAANFYPDPVPRWHFQDFFHSFMMIFRILCGEWVEPLWDCMRAEKDGGSETCLAIFLPALVMGNFMVLNLFLALLLNSFNSDELKSRQDDMEEESKVVELLVKMLNVFLPKRFKRKIMTEEERKAAMLAAEKADEELQAARMRELFGDFKQETTELMVDMDIEAAEPVKHVTIEEKDAMREKSKLREMRQNSKENRSEAEKGLKQAFSEPELRIEEEESVMEEPSKKGYHIMNFGFGDDRYSGRQESIELNEMREGGKRRKGRELPAEPRFEGSGGMRDFRGQRSDMRDSRDPREHSDLRDPRNSDRLRSDFAMRGKYRGGKNDWDADEGRVGTSGGIIDRPLRETRIYGDERDLMNERNSRRNFDRFAYLRDTRLALDTSGIGNRNVSSRYGLPFRKNDSLNDLRDEKYMFDRSSVRQYRGDPNRFPHHHSMRESRRDIHDRLDSKRRAYSGYTKGDQYNFRGGYDNERLATYRDGSSARDYFTREAEYLEKMRRADGTFAESSYHHSLPRKDSLRGQYNDYPNKGFPPSPTPPLIYDEDGRPTGRRGRYNFDDRYGGYTEDISDINMSESVLPRSKLKGNFNYETDGSGDNLPELAFDDDIKEDGSEPTTPLGNGGPGLKSVQSELQTAAKKSKAAEGNKSWGAVINYVDEITTGVKDDEDPRFMKPEKKQKTPPDCFPKMIYSRVGCCKSFTTTGVYKRWFRLRTICLRITDSPYFEWFILAMIMASSITLCFEDVHLDSNPDLAKILSILNTSFAVLFTMEMLLKWIAFGYVKYFTSVWTILDCFIVMVSISSLFVKQDNLIALRSLRTLRALRPLRAISRWQGMKIVVNALMYAIPSIFNVLLVCLVFWLIFSIMGVQMFGGRFYKCVDRESGDRIDVSIVNNKSECLEGNFSWVNSNINFDHVGYAYLALFQVATFEGWMEVMADAVDCRGIDLQPDREANMYAYIYFVIFIVCGSFFTLNLFIGVIIDNFNALKKKYEGGVLEMFLTDSQKNYYTAMKKLGRKKPQKVIRRPTYKYHAIFYDIAVSRRFEISIFVLIFLNMVSMAIEHHHQSQPVSFTLEVFNALFTTIFGLEAIVKIIGLRHHYFTVPWNLFDFILVFASITGILLQDVLTDFPISPTLLRVVRVFRIGRILRLIKAAKGIRKLLFALIVSLPALFNIGALLFLITFIYAIIGMAVFGHVQKRGALDDLVNFETFQSSMMLLFRLITSAGWNDVLDPLMAQPPDCDPDYKNQPNGNCGHPVIAIAFFVSFIIVNFMIVINMYIAVILENFNQAHKEEEIGIVEDDLEMFYVRWSKYDPHATQFINFSQLSDFIASLDSPFGIPKPNTVALVSFDLPIAKGDKIHCLDILHALTKHVLGHVEETEEFKRLKLQMEEKFKKQFPTRKELEIVSSTRRWKKMETAARVIQISWRVFKQRKRDQDRRNLLLEEAQTQTSSPGGSSIRSGFRKVSNLLSAVPLPMGVQRRRSVTVLQVDKQGGSRRNSRASVKEKTPSPRGSFRGSFFFLPLSRRASRSSVTPSAAPSPPASPMVSIQVHHDSHIDGHHQSHPDGYYCRDASGYGGPHDGREQATTSSVCGAAPPPTSASQRAPHHQRSTGKKLPTIIQQQPSSGSGSPGGGGASSSYQQGEQPERS